MTLAYCALTLGQGLLLALGLFVVILCAFIATMWLSVYLACKEITK